MNNHGANTFIPDEHWIMKVATSTGGRSRVLDSYTFEAPKHEPFAVCIKDPHNFEIFYFNPYSMKQPFWDYTPSTAANIMQIRTRWFAKEYDKPVPPMILFKETEEKIPTRWERFKLWLAKFYA